MSKSKNDTGSEGSSSSMIKALKVLVVVLIVALVVYEIFNNNIATKVSDSIKQFVNSHSQKIKYLDNVPFDQSAIGHEPKILRELIVKTKQGRLNGFVQNVSGIEVKTFLSVPYGQPPIGALRFRRTVPMKRWNDIRDATQFPPPCIQSEYTQRLFPVHILNENITEDCLYLNIWSPGTESNKKKTVMVLIHGGLFTIGSTSVDEYDGRTLAAYGDVVVVTIQYRLGIFGFLDMDTEKIPGNMGLFDQQAALKWIQQNIRYFGGDPDSVTLFGTSAGSISIGFHMFTPQTQNLFKRAILQSGSPMLLKDVYSRAEIVAEKFTTLIGCFKKGNESIYENPDPVVDCIDQTPFDVIYKAQDELVKDNPVPFMPTIPSEYIDTFINDYNDSTKIFQKEILMGFNLNEGALMLHLAYPKVYTRHLVPQYTRLKEVQHNVIRMAVDAGLREGQATGMANILIKGKEVDEPIHWAQTVADVFSDVMFVCPSYEFANKLSKLNVTIHMYLFAHRAQNSEWGEWMQVTHHDEINFIMGYPLRYPNVFSQEDINISAKMIKTWVHFAKTGQIRKDVYEETWRPYDSKEKCYMQIKDQQTQMSCGFHRESCDLFGLISDYLS